MGKYLVVSNQTATSPELIEGLQALRSRDPEAQFVLLVPATPSHERVGPQTDRLQTAEAVAARAEEVLRDAGLSILEAKTGDGLPMKAIGDEVESGNQIYHGIIVSTLAPETSQWMAQDLPRRVERRWGLPVRHIIAGEKN